MLNRAEFPENKTITCWTGKKFVTGSITKVVLNPISGVIEYTIFYREGAEGKRKRNFYTAEPTSVIQSKHYNGPDDYELKLE